MKTGIRYSTLQEEMKCIKLSKSTSYIETLRISELITHQLFTSVDSLLLVTGDSNPHYPDLGSQNLNETRRVNFQVLKEIPETSIISKIELTYVRGKRPDSSITKREVTSARSITSSNDYKYQS